MNEYKARRNGVVADCDVVGTSSRKGQQHQYITATQQQRRLTPSEKRLSRVVRASVDFVGAARFIVENGARLVLTVLREDVLEWRGVESIRVVDGLRLGWWPRAELRNPAGFLRKAVQERRFER